MADEQAVVDRAVERVDHGRRVEVATVNIRGTSFPTDHPRFQPDASVTLLRLDRRTGQLRRADERRFRGVLPEHATFDARGRHLAVTSFESLSPTRGGGLHLFRVAAGRLAPARDRIQLGRGVHQVELLR